MTPGNIVFLCIATGGITLFGLVLAWASWMEGRAQKRKSSRTQANASQSASRAETLTASRPRVLSRPF